MYVVGVADAGRRDGFTAAWVMQVSFDPLLLAVSINPGNASYPLLRGGGGFAISVLKPRSARAGAAVWDAVRARPRQAGRGEGGGPGRHRCAHSERTRWRTSTAHLSGSMRSGDHELVLGRVIDGRILAHDVEPMTYADTGDMDGSGALYPVTF